jgi:hypothetical protein
VFQSDGYGVARQQQPERGVKGEKRRKEKREMREESYGITRQQQAKRRGGGVKIV